MFFSKIGKANPSAFPADMQKEAQRYHDAEKQAINTDYEDIVFDRGHLNPAAYHCDAARNATFTLTNCVPQDPHFNRHIWNNLEAESKKLMKDMCHSVLGARSYFVTGAVPRNRMIPNPFPVTIPSYMWTAACYDTSKAINPEDTKKGFSFAYYGNNTISARPEALTVAELDSVVAKFLKQDHVKLFADNCFEDSEESKMALIKLRNALDETLPHKKKRKIVHEFIDTIPNKKKALNNAVQYGFEWDVRMSGVGVYLPPRKVIEYRKTIEASCNELDESSVQMTPQLKKINQTKSYTTKS